MLPAIILVLARAPTLAPLPPRASVSGAPIDRALAIRGGAALGRLDADLFSNVQLTVLGIICVELAIPVLTRPSRKYFNVAEGHPWLTWFAAMHSWLVALLVFAKVQGGMDPLILTQALATWFALSASLSLFQAFGSKTLMNRLPIYVSVPMALVGLYVGFA
ncbi:hypothetical protein KFE25_014286 [Diacronema lutheri]|uniref:Uncharacterized protein n=1 Tax=Diacronema lutheri TaxID=2081491 RepID=A0A8J5X7I2_DIALT|nr:hypothetical protein KFE25_014286 [Diacronema lutheri]